MNLTLTERDKKLLGLTACLAILAVFGVHLIRPALAEHEALGSEYEAALRKQQEYQAQIDARAALDDSIAQNEAALLHRPSWWRRRRRGSESGRWPPPCRPPRYGQRGISLS